MADVQVACEELRRNYSPCDISDALLVLKVPGSGHLADIHPLPSRSQGKNRVVAPVSTIQFVPKALQATDTIPNGISKVSNLPKDKHWTDVPPSGSIVIMQTANLPDHAPIIAGLLGDIVASRFKARGVLGAVVDGRSRDVVGIGKICEDGTFQAWTRALTSVGTGMQAKPWAVDIPLTIGSVEVKPGDILCADEAEHVVAVIPRERLQEVLDLLPKLKKADDEVLKDAQSGTTDLKTSFASHPDHYTHFH